MDRRCYCDERPDRPRSCRPGHYQSDRQCNRKSGCATLSSHCPNLKSPIYQKFTAKSEVRRITVKFDLSFSPPSSDTCVPPSSGADHSTMKEIRKDTPVWLFVSVEDTGPGLSPSERAVLFQRFSRE